MAWEDWKALEPVACVVERFGEKPVLCQRLVSPDGAEVVVFAPDGFRLEERRSTEDEAAKAATAAVHDLGAIELIRSAGYARLIALAVRRLHPEEWAAIAAAVREPEVDAILAPLEKEFG